QQILDVFEAQAAIGDLVKLRADGGPNRLDEALEIAKEWGFDETEVRGRFEEAELALEEVWPDKKNKFKLVDEEAQASFKNSAVQPAVEEAKIASKPEQVKESFPRRVFGAAQQVKGTSKNSSRQVAANLTR